MYMITEMDLQTMRDHGEWCNTDEGQACETEREDMYQRVYEAHAEVIRMNSEHEKKYQAWLDRKYS